MTTPENLIKLEIINIMEESIDIVKDITEQLNTWEDEGGSTLTEIEFKKLYEGDGMTCFGTILVFLFVFVLFWSIDAYLAYDGSRFQ